MLIKVESRMVVTKVVNTMDISTGSPVGLSIVMFQICSRYTITADSIEDSDSG